MKLLTNGLDDTLPCLYKVTNNANGKFYVGSTMRGLKTRIYDHEWKLQKNIHPNKHLQAAWNFYNTNDSSTISNCFSATILKVFPRDVDKKFLLQEEQKLLDQVWDGSTLCYNMEPTVRRTKVGTRTPEEVRLRQSLSQIGRKHSPEHKQKLRLAHLGKKHSPETKEKIRKALAGRKKALPVSQETREKMRRSHLGLPVSQETREKYRKFHLGFKYSEESRRKMSESAKRRMAQTNTPEWRQKISEGLKLFYKTGVSKQERTKIEKEMRSRLFAAISKVNTANSERS